MTIASLGKTVLITGAARRIGATLASALATDGWKVLIHYNRSKNEAEALLQTILAEGGDGALMAADLSDRAHVEALISKCIAQHGALDCLVNNAAQFNNDTITDVTWDSLQTHLVPNLVAPLILSRDFARAFGDRTGGCIINILSYTVSKIGLSGLTEVLALAFRGHIRVCGVAPGLTLISGKQTETSFEKAWRATPSGRSSTPNEIADAVRFILATPSFTGQTIFLDGGESIRPRSRDVAFDLLET
jgi:NAD(P)-dependent dehydrogenase (short-subunit alcohol dehydrogenase family)